MSAELNMDCWNLVLEQLYGDFRTLAKVMLTCKQLLAFIAPQLYSQLGDLANFKAIDNWSFKKRSRLATLLLMSSGCIDPQTDTEEDQILYRYRICDSTFKFYQTPLTMNYFGFLKQLPRTLIGDVIWRVLIEDEKQLIPDGEMGDDRQKVNEQDTGNKMVDQRHARVFTDITIRNQYQIEKWLRWTEEFSRLSKITLYNSTHLSDLTKEKLIEFVTRHRAAHPGRLVQIESTNVDQTEFVTKLNRLLQPTKIQLGEVCEMDLVSEQDESGYLKNVKEFVYEEQISSQRKRAQDVDRENTTLNLSRILQHCRDLQKIKLELSRFSRSNWDQLLSWAPKEFLGQQRLVESTASEFSNLSLSLSLLSTLPDPTKRLIPLKEFTGVNIPASVFTHAMDGFRYTLEKIVFHGWRTSECIDSSWAWPLSRLKILKLAGGMLVMSKLHQWCPVLEELKLKNVTPAIAPHESEITSWQLPPRLKRLSLIGRVFAGLDLESIGQLDRLEYLFLSYLQFDIYPRQLDFRASAWKELLNLKYLILRNQANVDWQWHLLNLSPNLELFASPSDTIVLQESWWCKLDDDFCDERTDTEEEQIKSGDIVPIEKMGDDDEAWFSRYSNTRQSKIRVLRFSCGATWTSNHMKDFAHLLKQTHLWFTSFPDLSYVQLDDPPRNGAEKYPSCAAFDELTMVLMCRPKMRRVVTMYWQPSSELIATKLEELKKHELPRNIFRTENPEDDLEMMGEIEECKCEWTDQELLGFCVLVIRETRKTQYFRVAM